MGGCGEGTSAMSGMNTNCSLHLLVRSNFKTDTLGVSSFSFLLLSP